jgi:ribonuclease VapC
MIVDTSALVAILKREAGFERLLDAIGLEGGGVPAPALVEFLMVAAGADLTTRGAMLLDALREAGLVTIAFTAQHAATAGTARDRYGKGNGRGGRLNLLDLMVYAVAREQGEPLLCTGRDFASTDLQLHPASRDF